MNLYYHVRTWLQAKFTESDRGASMIEYALLAALIAIVVIVVVTAVGSSTSSKFSEVDSGLQ